VIKKDKNTYASIFVCKILELDEIVVVVVVVVVVL